MAAPHLPTWHLVVYVVGGTARAQHTVQALERLCRRLPPDTYRIDVVDVLVDPDLAERDGITATPSIVRRTPAPEILLVGRLEADEWAAYRLGLPPEPVSDAGTGTGAGADEMV